MEIPEELPSRAVIQGRRAVIAIPSVSDFYFTAHRFSSLGARILEKLLSQFDIHVSIFDFPLLGKHPAPLVLPRELSHLQGYFSPMETGKLSYFTEFKRFGPPHEACAAAAVARSPDLCFISCFAYAYGNDALALARSFKRIAPRLPVILGGAGPSAHPHHFIRDPAVDFVLTHEAEASIGPFLAAVCGTGSFEQVPNCYWKKGDEVRPPKVNLLTEAREISVVVSKAHETRTAVYYSTSLSRGCPKRCGFCSNFLTHGIPFRVAPLDGVRQALAGVQLANGNRAMKPDVAREQTMPAGSGRNFEVDSKKTFIVFEDDNLLFNKEYCFDVMRVFGESFREPSFLFENGIDYTLLSPGLIDRLAKAGVAKFNLSIGTADPASAKRENRPLDLDHYQEVAAAIGKRSIPCITYFICGLEADTKESVARTLAFLHSQPTSIGISLFYAVPGIKGYEDLSRFDGLSPLLCCGSSAYPWNGTLSTETMITAFRLSRFCNLVKQEKKSAQEEAAVRAVRETGRLFTFMKTKKGVELAPVERYDRELVELFFRKVSGNVIGK